jgi:hypothetical protein
MKVRDLLKALRKVKGPLLAAVNSCGDTKYFRLVTSDVIAQFADSDPESETGYKVDTYKGDFYFEAEENVGDWGEPSLTSGDVGL